MNKIEKIDRTTKYLDKILDFFVIICFLSSVFFVVFNVFTRVFFGVSFATIEELCRYTIIYSSFLYLGPLIIQNEHIKMDLLQSLIKGKLKNIHSMIVDIIVLISTLVLFWTSASWVYNLYQMKVLTNSNMILMAVPAAAVPLGMFFGSLYAIKQVVIDFNLDRSIQN